MAALDMFFDIALVDTENDYAETHFVSTPGDFMRLSKWAEKNLPPTRSEANDNMRKNYAIAWFALSRLGRLGEYGLPDEITEDAIEAMADRYALDVERFDTDKAPLADGRG